METNIEQNNNSNQSSGKGGSVLHFFFLFFGFILFLIGLSYAIKWLMA